MGFVAAPSGAVLKFGSSLWLSHAKITGLKINKCFGTMHHLVKSASKDAATEVVSV